MKATELIIALGAAIAEHGDLEVMTEGCDCTGMAGRVVKEDDEFMITRGGGESAWDGMHDPSTLEDVEDEWL